MQATCQTFPGLANWTNWCYQEESTLLFDHREVITSSSGVQQGDPLSPLYFCFALNGLVQEISSLKPEYQKWYMDDGGIVASVPVLLKVWALLKEKGPARGLHLNPSKCEWSWLSESRTDPCPIEGVTLVPTSEICILGVPLGSASFSASFVEGKLFSRVQKAMERLRELDDSQSAMFLLRISYGIVRATHFMRTTSLGEWKNQAERFDREVRRLAEDILGSPLDDRAWTQACLTPSLGGLGLRRVVDHADGAFAASWHESQATAHESWTPPAQASVHKGSQTETSLAFDKAVHERLIAESSSQREKQRLRRLVADHAGAWVTAVPSRIEGSDCVMSPPAFCTAVRYRLGVPVARPDVTCSFCMQPFDLYGDHAACCKKNGDVIVRHNRIRNLVSKIGDEGILNPVLEKRGILGDSKKPGRRPGDVTFPTWQDSRGLAVDVCVTSPFSTKNFRSESPADDYGLRKHRKYDASFEKTTFSFCALALETTGGVSEEGLTFLKQLWRFGARRQNTKLCVYAGRAWARLSCNLQTSVAQAILHRVPTGGQPAKRSPVEASVVPLEVVSQRPAHVGPFSASFSLCSSTSPFTSSCTCSSVVSSHAGTQVRGSLSSFSPSRSFSSTSSSTLFLSSVSSPSTLLPRLTQVGVTSPGETAAVSALRGWDYGVGGAMTTRLRTIARTPVIPVQSEGRGPILPLTAGQSFTPPSSFPQSPLFDPSVSAMRKNQEEKDRVETQESKKGQNAVAAAGWRGSTNMPNSCTDVKGFPSTLFIHPPLYPTSTGGTRIGCSSPSPCNGCSLCSCSPSRDTSQVAGSRDTSLVALPQQPARLPSPSVCLSDGCCCLSPSVCLCRDYEKTQG